MNNATTTGTSNGALRDRDLAHLIHPLHDEAAHAHAKVWIKGDGAMLTDADGREFIDGLVGLWNVTAGHGRIELAEAMRNQAATLAYASSYSGSSNSLVRLQRPSSTPARKVAAIATLLVLAMGKR